MLLFWSSVYIFIIWIKEKCEQNIFIKIFPFVFSKRKKSHMVFETTWVTDCILFIYLFFGWLICWNGEKMPLWVCMCVCVPWLTLPSISRHKVAKKTRQLDVPHGWRAEPPGRPGTVGRNINTKLVSPSTSLTLQTVTKLVNNNTQSGNMLLHKHLSFTRFNKAAEMSGLHAGNNSKTSNFGKCGCGLSTMMPM